MPERTLSFQTSRRRSVSPERSLRTLLDNARQRFLDPAPLVQAEKTPYEVIYQEDIVQLRYYPPLAEDHIEVAGQPLTVNRQSYPVPLVLVSPLAVNMLIYDLFPHRSLVKYLRARGFEVYLIDWGRPGWRHNHLHLASYFADWMPKLLTEVRQHSGQQKLSLHGWSLGGLFSLCYTALGDPDIVNLTLVGAPCDYHANGNLGQQYQRLSRSMRWLEERFGWYVHDTPKRWWRSPGWANSLGFKILNPVNSLQGYLDLFRNLHRTDYVRDHATNGAFLDDMVAYPGGVIQDIIQYLITDNCLAQGLLPIARPAAGLDQVQANLLLVCGNNDPIVTPKCSLAMLQQVSSQDHQVLKVPGGHMGILSGSKAPEQIWPQVADWLAERSTLSQPREQEQSPSRKRAV